jgi:dolichol-phosphate mannosyltransferase
MSDEGEATVARRPHAVHVRVRAGMSKPANWLQLAKFCAVGGSGYVVNLAVFALCVEGLGAHHLVAATAAFGVAVVNNFWWNRHWTFDARSGRRRFQAPRFFAVSIAAFLVAATVLEVLVSAAGMNSVAAQAISIAVSTPLNFVGNKIWSFAIEVSRD